VVLPVLTTCFGPRTAWAGLVATTWPVTSDRTRRPRDLPNRVRRLIELGYQRREADYRGYLDDANWQGEGDIPDDLSGLIVVRDLRD
jgi:hypothetical protein